MASLAKPEKRVETKYTSAQAHEKLLEAVRFVIEWINQEKTGVVFDWAEEDFSHAPQLLHTVLRKATPHVAFIVRACNSHGPLVEALEKLLAYTGGGCPGNQMHTPETCCCCGARAALVLANVDPDDPATLARTADAVIESGVLEGDDA